MLVTLTLYSEHILFCPNYNIISISIVTVFEILGVNVTNIVSLIYSSKKNKILLIRLEPDLFLMAF